MAVSERLGDLLPAGEFEARHNGPTAGEVEAMLAELGADSLAELIDRIVPAAIRATRPLDLPPPLAEHDLLAFLRSIASKNRLAVPMIGMGYHGTHLPPVILRNLLENPGWYTAYTPYQAEVSQGRLEALLNWQQMIADLTGMELANASLLDEGTAAAEAMAMARRVGKSGSSVFFLDSDTHPQTAAVVRTRARHLGIEIVEGRVEGDLGPCECFAALLSYPGSSGALRDPSGPIRDLHARGALAIVATDLLALTLVASPGELGADIVVGSAQRFGVPMGFGGPHAAFFATRDAFKRSMPGRLIGVSVDSRGEPALRMALQTREQHIRREKATSNICTAQVLLAVIAGMYGVYHGAEGLRKIAMRVHLLTRRLAYELARQGLDLEHHHFFDTITLRVPGRARDLAKRAGSASINIRLVDDDRIGIALDETTVQKDLRRLLAAFGIETDAGVLIEDARYAGLPAAIPRELERRSSYLTHPVFSLHRSETRMLRYLRRLQGRDIALDRSMIPLGSCTMKLNATAEMIPVTWPEFANMHPFAPLEQAQGYVELFTTLERWLCEITGFDAVSFQPNAGSQGEYAGLLAIRAYHESRGQGSRDVCLIPSSAHGTNPASAVLAGLKVVVVACDDEGNVDLDDLASQIAAHHDKLAALMVTYPSTHGVFEAAIKDICAMVHEAGGQVYMDGANLNALVGIARPAEFGADVSHMNLHKTFCIPHGGGGPGMGPIGVRAHLAPFLPGHPVRESTGGAQALGTISAAPWGSASILPISFAYIAMMGPKGLTRATELAILNANYVARRLGAFYPIVYKGRNGMVAHECIIDLRGIKAKTGISAEDVAKRLVDYGFHAPTMSWPVAETMMVEPTESESKGELDRFCDAMIAIREEIAQIERGEADPLDNLLKNAPHPPSVLIGAWTRPYERERAVYPLSFCREDKYWPPVGRIDNVHGDRHVVCSCPPLEVYAQAAE